MWDGLGPDKMRDNKIQIISGFTQNKISRVYDHMNRNSNISEIINMKLNRKTN